MLFLKQSLSHLHDMGVGLKLAFLRAAMSLNFGSFSSRVRLREQSGRYSLAGEGVVVGDEILYIGHTFAGQDSTCT